MIVCVIVHTLTHTRTRQLASSLATMYSAASVVASCLVLSILAIVVTALRFYVRLVFRKSWIGIDDVVTVIALAFVVTIAMLCVACAYVGNVRTGNKYYTI